MKIDRHAIKQFRAEFADAVSKLEKKHGVRISLGNITYNDNSFRSKMEVSNLVTVGNDTAAASIPEQYRKFVTTPFVYQGNTYVLLEWHSRRPKFPALVKRQDGKTFKVTKALLDTVLISG